MSSRVKSHAIMSPRYEMCEGEGEFEEAFHNHLANPTFHPVATEERTPKVERKCASADDQAPRPRRKQAKGRSDKNQGDGRDRPWRADRRRAPAVEQEAHGR